jgi:hypothetical protein
MHGKLPEIFWYLFWVGFVVLAFRMAYLGGKSGYDTRMRALDILKMYAEKGTEPPPAMMQQLAEQAFEQRSPAASKDPRAGWLVSFNSFLFMACVSWGLRAWLAGGGGPAWQTIAATAAMAFFGIGAFGFLLAVLVARPK